jgi:hypothetical protein
MPDTRKIRDWVLVTALLLFAVGNGVLLWRSRESMAKGYFDFANFYTAGVLVHRGLGTEIYNSATEWTVQQEFSSEVKERRGPMRFLRPPFEALFFSLFARWPYARALLIWTLLKLALLFALPLVVVRHRPWREVFPLWATPILILGTFPACMELLLGQDAILLAFLYAICFWQLDVGNDLGAGLVLGLALFKFQFALPYALILWIVGRTKAVAGFAITASFLTAISGVVVGWRNLVHYPGYLLKFNRTTGVGIAPNPQMTLRGLLTIFVGRAPYPGRIHWLLAPIALGAVVYAGWLWRRAGKQYLAEGFGLVTVAAIVTSYYAYSYDLLLLLVPLLAMRTRPNDDGGIGIPSAISGQAPARPAGRGRPALQSTGLDVVTGSLETVGVTLLLLAPLYWLAKAEFQAECLMAIPLIAVGIALARRLHKAAGESMPHPKPLASVTG